MKTETFEEKLNESKKILNQLINPSITLEESIKLYENGLVKIKEAQSMIEEAKIKIITIDNKSNNTI